VSLAFINLAQKTMRKIPVLFWTFFIAVSCSSPPSRQIKFQGETQGTYYVVTYYNAEANNLQAEIDSLLADFDTVASMWVENSLISILNRQDTATITNNDFIQLFKKSKYIYSHSAGAFDPTVGPLVNAWGFGFTDRMKVDSAVVDSLLPLVGFNKVKFEAGKFIKEDPRIQFDFNAIAQGYSVDLVGKFLENHGIDNYLIDIGGEVLGEGKKPTGEPWKVGIEKPSDNAQYGEALEAIVKLENKAMATSGNYRKFYVENGVRYAHTIDPKSGYPVQHSILSVSVLADECGMADGWATAFMVLGLEKSIAIVEHDPGLDAYFIYSDKETGEMKTYFTEGFRDLLIDTKY